ncbi:MAG: HDOD domain-containing protein [Myxococcota bacterium]
MDHRALVRRVEEVCPLPAAAQRVLALTSNPSSDMADVVAALAADPALAAEVLRVANSPAFGAKHPASDIASAALRLGMNELQNMSSAMAMMAAFRSDHEAATEFHSQAVFSGEIAVNMAQALHHPQPRSLFLCGLLAEVGALACLAVDGDAYAAIYARASGDLEWRAVLEAERYCETSAEIGAALLERNHLPDFVCQAVRGDHPEETESRITQFARHTAPALIAAGKAEDPQWLAAVVPIAARFDVALAPAVLAEVLTAAGSEAITTLRLVS